MGEDVKGIIGGNDASCAKAEAGWAKKIPTRIESFVAELVGTRSAWCVEVVAGLFRIPFVSQNPHCSLLHADFFKVVCKIKSLELR